LTIFIGIAVVLAFWLIFSNSTKKKETTIKEKKSTTKNTSNAKYPIVKPEDHLFKPPIMISGNQSVSGRDYDPSSSVTTAQKLDSFVHAQLNGDLNEVII
jgi:hypothetical protein